MTTFKEFEDDDKSDNGGNQNNDDDDDYDSMLSGSSKTLQKGKVGSKSNRASIKKNPKAVMTQD